MISTVEEKANQEEEGKGTCAQVDPSIPTGEGNRGRRRGDEGSRGFKAANKAAKSNQPQRLGRR
jgi:hypothetical protein